MRGEHPLCLRREGKDDMGCDIHAMMNDGCQKEDTQEGPGKYPRPHILFATEILVDLVVIALADQDHVRDLVVELD